MDMHERAALRNAPAWDRWQAVRMPETVDEADAAIALVTMKRAALERTAADEPGRADGLLYAADQWASRLTELVWAREVLCAGESPAAVKYRELRERHDALISTAAENPDTRALIDTLLARLRRAEDRAAEYDVERTGRIAAEKRARATIKGQGAAIASLRQKLAELEDESGVTAKSAEVAALKSDAAQKDAEIAGLRRLLSERDKALNVAQRERDHAMATIEARRVAGAEVEALRAVIEEQRTELARFHATAGKLAGHLVTWSLAREKETTRKQREVIDELTARFERLSEKDQARAMRAAPPTPSEVTPERRAAYIASQHSNTARAIYAIRELVAHGGAHTPITKYLLANFWGSLPAERYDAWLAEDLPRIADAMRRHASASDGA